MNVTEDNFIEKCVLYGLWKEDDCEIYDVKNIDIHVSKGEVYSILGISDNMLCDCNLTDSDIEKAICFNCLIKHKYNPEIDKVDVRKILIDYLHSLDVRFNVGW